MSELIAIVGAACRYPDAPDPDRLWELVLARRKAFRPIPRGRLDPDGYVGDGVDGTYVRFAAVLEGWEFDRARFRVPGVAYRAADLTHWLALEVAADTLASAGYPEGHGLDPERVGVIVGNTLTGEFSRSSLLRLRWPYVRRVLQESLLAGDMDPDAAKRLLDRVEHAYKAPFPEPTDESLAGGLANTIAGRICNHFDLRGGGYIVDGACSSSLLAVITACTALREGDVDLALAGGVDLSLDPFELVGFARTGALATSAMRVYDASPTGFWPGEGCGMVALMRADDAMAVGRAPLALIRGWGVSSDGQGGITRPEMKGQLLALQRAYQRAGFGPETVSLFEGHGTGTAVGDAVELATLLEAQRRRDLPPAAIGSIKANLGHTKAAAGMAGLLKAVLALQRQVIPPTTGCDQPHELLRSPGAPLRVVQDAEPWPDAPLRAGVSAMGFGGINTHVVLEAAAPPTRRALSATERRTARLPLSHEIFAFAADSVPGLVTQLERVAEVAETMSFAEHGDLAAALARNLPRGGATSAIRVAVVSRDPAQLARRVRQAVRLLPETESGGLATAPGVFACRGGARRVGLLFTGQGAPVPATAGALGRLVPERDSRFRADDADPSDTAVAQPAIVSASLAGLAWLSDLGLSAEAAAGHSLGEITALCWAGAFPETAATDLAAFRGRAMSRAGTPGTGMASVGAPAATVARLIEGTGLVISADNGPAQVVAGPVGDLERMIERARAEGVQAQRLRVSHAFHSPAVAGAEDPLADHLGSMPVAPLTRTVYSTVTGRALTPLSDVRRLLARQVTAPVRFREAVESLATVSDLLLEVGPGRSLASLAAGITTVPAIALDIGADSAEGLCQAAAALYAAGAVTDLRPLFTGRFHRPFDLWRAPSFLTNPCESASPPGPRALEHPHPDLQPEPQPEPQPDGDVVAVVRRVVAAAVELPAEAIGDEDRLLSDLHLNSLRVAQLAAQAAQLCEREVPAAPVAFGDVTLSELAAVIENLPHGDGQSAAAPIPPGVSDWHRVFAEETEPLELSPDGVERRDWRLLGRGPLRQAVQPLLATSRTAAPAIAVFLPEDPDDSDVQLLVAAAREAMADQIPLTVVDQGLTASGFLAAIRQEGATQPVRWVRAACSAACPHATATLARVLCTPDLDVPDVAESGTMSDAPESGAMSVVPGSGAMSEIVVLEHGQTARVVHRPVPVAGGTLPLGPRDVVLITGGGKGIGFETAVGLARYGIRLALLGRADPAADEELRRNLARLADIVGDSGTSGIVPDSGTSGTGARFHYEAADVRDAGAVRRAVAELTRRLGPITGVIHSSGINRPGRFTDLTEQDYADHAAPKHHALRTVLAALDTSRLRAVVTYGSVIGRFGLAGEAHYALANGRLRELARSLARELPDAFVCNVDWTAWSGAGMGERLAVIDSLVRSGVVPLPVDRGVELLLGLLAARPAVPSVLVTGRLPALHLPGRGAWHVPGVELVTETELTAAGADYLADHRIDGLRVLPAVYALEAMAQAARTLLGNRPISVRDAQFHRPVVVPDEGPRTIRICAQIREDGDVDVVVRSDETNFAVDHFACRIVTAVPDVPDVPARTSRLPAHDGAGLYGPLFFHGPFFQRLRRYDHLAATGCTALLSDKGESGFALGDPARNDASIHVLQACVPHRRLLPVGCAGFAVHGGETTGDTLVLAAVERAHKGPEYVYDVVVRDAAGRPVVSWAGLTLRDVGPLDSISSWPPVLLGPYLQRSVAALVPDSDVWLDVAAAPARTAGRGLDGPHTSDGRPIPVDGVGWSRSHLDGMVLTASSPDAIACDWEPVPDRVDQLRSVVAWPGHVDELMRLTGDREAHALARLWTVQECLSKTGRGGGPLVVQGAYERGWVLLRAGTDVVASAVVEVEGQGDVAVAVLTRGLR